MVGNDPESLKGPSIEVVLVPNSWVIGLDELLPALAEGRYLSPISGYWRGHDEMLHDARLREMHPVTAGFVMEVAGVMHSIINTDRAVVDEAAHHLDTFIGPTRNMHALRELINFWGESTGAQLSEREERYAAIREVDAFTD